MARLNEEIKQEIAEIQKCGCSWMNSSTRDRLVQMVTAEPGKYHEAELGRMLGVRRQRVHAIAVEEEVHHLIKRQRRHTCTRCGRHTRARLWLGLPVKGA